MYASSYARSYIPFILLRPCDFDLDPTSLIYELDVDMKIYLRYKNISKVRGQTGQTDSRYATERIITAAAYFVNMCHCRIY